MGDSAILMLVAVTCISMLFMVGMASQVFVYLKFKFYQWRSKK